MQFIYECKQNNGKILIHCLAGMNRSATVVVAYLLYGMGMDLLTAIKHTQQQRGYVLQNLSFRQQLIYYASKLRLLKENVKP